MTRPPARPAANAGREVAHVAALGADPGQQERRARHQLAHAREVLGHGRAGHRADVGERRALPQLGGERGEPLPQRLAGGEREVEHVGGAGVGGAHEQEDAGAGGAGALDERDERVAPEQRVGGEGVDREAGRGAERRRRAADERLGVGGGGHGDVAALAVGEHEQPGGARVLAGGLEREPAGGAEALEAGELGLDRDAGGAGGVDQRAAVDEDGGGGLRGGGGGAGRAGGVGRVDERDGEALALLADGLAGVGPEAGGIGVDPEDDLRLAGGDRRGESVAKAGRR